MQISCSIKGKVEISIVVPLYRCADYLIGLSERLIKVLDSLSIVYEIIYVNDGSPQGDWQIVQTLSAKHYAIKGINLSRNFGQHYAITAGLETASGEWIVVMDGDLQDQPEEITVLYNKALEGYDIVMGLRTQRQDKWLKKVSSAVFYRVFSYLTDTKQDERVANFGIYNRTVVNAILKMKDAVKYFPTMVQWVGFKKTKVSINHARRKEGGSSYTFKTLLKLAFDNIIAFSDKPLRLTVSFGFLLTILALLFAGIVLVRYSMGGIVVSGYASLIFSIWFLSGLIIAIMGIIGIYIGKVFERVKDRPVYIIAEKINFDS